MFRITKIEMEGSNINPILSSDDSCDSEIRHMKTQLTEFGLEEENLSKEEMIDLLKALQNSKESAKDDDILRKVNNSGSTASSQKIMKRRYQNVKDRRMPWSILPNSITQAEKARSLAVYIKLMAINSYCQARQSANFASWPPPIQIVEETIRIQPLRSTRSGRSVPIYSGFDDDSSDLDFVVKTKKRKVSTSESNTSDANSNKVLSLKRKSSKDENTRPVKEARSNTGIDKFEEIMPGSSLKTKKDIFMLVED